MASFIFDRHSAGQLAAQLIASGTPFEAVPQPYEFTGFSVDDEYVEVVQNFSDNRAVRPFTVVGRYADGATFSGWVDAPDAMCAAASVPDDVEALLVFAGELIVEYAP